MRINFLDARRPARVAKLLRAALAAQGSPIGLLGSQNATARLYGYATYHEMKAALGRDGASPWDEACPPEVVAARRAFQVRSLVASGMGPVAAEAFVEANRPTGTRRAGPQGDATADASAQGLPPEIARALSEAGLRLVPGEGTALRVAQVSGAARGPWHPGPATPPAAGERHRFAEFLRDRGLAGRVQLDTALAEQASTGALLGQIMVRNGFLAPATLVDALREYGHDPEPERVTHTRIPVDVMERMNIVVTAETDDMVYAGTLEDRSVVDSVFARYYPDKAVRYVRFPDGAFLDFIRRVRHTETENVRQDEILERLLRRALKGRASDVHIEPKADSYVVFFRRLGERVLAHMGSRDEYETLVSQLKDRSRMDLAERRIGQDGGFQIEHSGRHVDLRVATVPAVEGEQVVVRVLDPDRVRPKLGQLGISGVGRWQRGITRKNGLCLICGATGSGRTTTLNASVRELDRFGKNIFAVGDHEERRIPYPGHIPAYLGLGFAQAVRNFMRADPDVMILGEMRDHDTARNAVKAAETGHLVIATVAAGSITSAINSVADCGIPPYELRFILRSVLVQTLVKAVCGSCGGHGHDRGDICPDCNGFGYSDRTIVSECTSFDTHSDVDRAFEASRTGAPVPWEDMVADGILKMRQGITTSDVLRQEFGSRFDERMATLGLDPGDFALARIARARAHA